ncbi:hypothetical protein HMPREF1250_0653 [Megasphaera vaginalis (ex Srinivasan et al. 2021)]|uniref:Uncharacterized protein n=1 Tax=Megasphaera vaginalis (ex Srinivasan et al. 2021) TaxID=1111454 RepID=U7UEX7_9FIRM|nr:hypothetical protein HMPREF1250_0653 [Megasphaera vaginalis (ex Srinivasan et al. 2021)]
MLPVGKTRLWDFIGKVMPQVIMNELRIKMRSRSAVFLAVYNDQRILGLKRNYSCTISSKMSGRE